MASSATLEKSEDRRHSLAQLAPLQAVLFDIDGTLCDSDPIHHAAFSELLLELGYNDGVPITREFFIKNIAGKINEDIGVALFPHWDDDKRSKFLENKEATYRRIAPGKLQPVGGLYQITKWVKDHGLKCAAVTNAPRENAELMISVLGLTNFFDVLVIGDECQHPKPHPDPYLRALDALIVSKNHSFVFEDSCSGITAGVAAGMPVVGLKTGNPEEILLKAKPAFLINDYQDPKLWEAIGIGLCINHQMLLRIFLSSPLTHRKSSIPNFIGFLFFSRRLSYAEAAYRRKSPDPDDPRNLIKEDAISICSQMWIDNFQNPKSTATNLSSYIRKFELWILAYQKVSADDTGSYMPRSSIDRSAFDDLLALRNAVLDSRFKWGARLKFFVRSPKDRIDQESLSKRKIRIILTTTQPTPFQDRVVQEVLFMILEPIYEARFSQRSFAFRPGRTPHTVLRVIRRSFAGYLWYIKGDLSTVLDGMKVRMVIRALMRDVRDKRVIDLIKDALITPVVTTQGFQKPKKKKKRKYQKKKVLAEDEPKPDPYWLETFFGFAPEEAERVPSWGHCGILSPLLANVCFDELDHWMDERIDEFYRPSKHDVIWNQTDGGVDQEKSSWPEFVPTSGPNKTRRMDYIRYGGHILVGVRGPRADAANLRRQLVEFCDQRYLLKLDYEDLPIEHITKGIMFLDHVLCRQVVYPTLRYTATGGKIISEKGVGTLLSVSASLKQCIKQFRKLSFLKGDRDPDPQPCFRMFHATQAHTNSQMNKLLLTMVEWYRFADNRKKVVNFFSYIVRGSLAKLYAAKYKLRSRAKVYKIGSRNLERPLKEKKGLSPEYNTLRSMGLTESIEGLHFTRLSLVPEPDYTPFPSNWRPRHEILLLEYIMLNDPKTMEEHRSCLREKGLISPQEFTSMLVWNYKKNAGSGDNGSPPVAGEEEVKEGEDSRERRIVAEM